MTVADPRRRRYEQAALAAIPGVLDALARAVCDECGHPMSRVEEMDAHRSEDGIGWVHASCCRQEGCAT